MGKKVKAEKKTAEPVAVESPPANGKPHVSTKGVTDPVDSIKLPAETKIEVYCAGKDQWLASCTFKGYEFSGKGKKPQGALQACINAIFMGQAKE